MHDCLIYNIIFTLLTKYNDLLPKKYIYKLENVKKKSQVLNSPSLSFRSIHSLITLEITIKNV